MSKIKRIQIKNFKAITEAEANFNGATAIITGGNNKGKSSLLRGIPDRIRGEKPELIVKEGGDAGSGTLELTSGEQFVWEFDKKGKDKLTFITEKGFKAAVTKAIAHKFFPPVFDIDVFLESQPKEQSKMLQKLVGIDFTEIDLEYKNAYDERTLANKLLEQAKAKLPSIVPVEFEAVDTAELIKEKEEVRAKLNQLYTHNKQLNSDLRQKWQMQCDDMRENVIEFNVVQDKNNANYTTAIEVWETLKELGYEGGEVGDFTAKLAKKIEPYKEFINPAEPQYLIEMPDDAELKALDEKLNMAASTNASAQLYTNYLADKKDADDKTLAAETADVKVKEVEERKRQLLNSAKLPAGIEMDDVGIYVDGFLLDKNQISTSKLYTAALRLASLNIGEVRTLYFDASPLDKITLGEIQKWAEENDLQLLIEKTDFEGGEIAYELIEEIST